MHVARPKISKSGYDVTPLTAEQVGDLATKLTAEQYRVTQRAGTEPAFCGNLLDNHRNGIYTCVVCGLPLFSSANKFESGTGWPSFFKPTDRKHITTHEDVLFGIPETEIRCARCGAHLGHVFADGPRPTGLRYCLNSAALRFVEAGQPAPAEEKSPTVGIGYFAGGCFWGVEHAFELIPGVVDAVSGYQNGRTSNPTYLQVSSDTTGHAETVKVVYDPTQVSYEQLVRFFFAIHDPTSLNAQGSDVGTQYRSAIFVRDDAQKAVAEKVIRELTERNAFGGRPIVTAVEPAGPFWPAEEFHQDYAAKTGVACYANVAAALEAAGAGR